MRISRWEGHDLRVQNTPLNLNFLNNNYVSSIKMSLTMYMVHIYMYLNTVINNNLGCYSNIQNILKAKKVCI